MSKNSVAFFLFFRFRLPSRGKNGKLSYESHLFRSVYWVWKKKLTIIQRSFKSVCWKMVKTHCLIQLEIVFTRTAPAFEHLFMAGIVLQLLSVTGHYPIKYSKISDEFGSMLGHVVQGLTWTHLGNILTLLIWNRTFFYCFSDTAALENGWYLNRKTLWLLIV